MRFVVSGGGTAGHIYPALSVASSLAGERDEVIFVGTPDGLEARLVPEAGLAFRPLKARGFDRARPWTLITSTLRILLSALEAWRWFGSERPDAVVGFGGYVSIPVGLAAAWRGVPLVLHEQNSVPGLANRVLSRSARIVAVTYEESFAQILRSERVVVTGNPVRAEVLGAARDAGRLALGLAPDDVVVLVFGGSRGARHLNSAVAAMAGKLMELPGVRVVQVTGTSEFETVRAVLPDQAVTSGRWRLHPYIDDMGSALAAADVVVARAGATSIAEITALGLPAILVPYPYATDDHQTKNARAMVDHGAALCIADRDLDGPMLSEALLGLLGDPARRATMSAASAALGHADAAERVAGLAREAALNRSRE